MPSPARRGRGGVRLEPCVAQAVAGKLTFDGANLDGERSKVSLTILGGRAVVAVGERLLDVVVPCGEHLGVRQRGEFLAERARTLFQT